MASDDRDLDAIRARHAARVAGQPQPNQPKADDDLSVLLEELDRLRSELNELRELNEDLRASSEMWARLYEANVERANTAEQARDRQAGTPVKNPPTKNVSRG